MSDQPATLQGLNPPQQEAVTSTEGPLLILAGAGSGKTRVLTLRIATLLSKGVEPWQILAVTFTNKAAAEMRERVADIVGPQAQQLWVSTFHSSCARILRRDAEVLGYASHFVIYDDDDQERLIKTILQDLGIDKKREPPRKFTHQIDRAKNEMMSPEEVGESDPTGSLLPRVYREYETRLKAANAMDFNDLINQVVRLFREHPEVLERWQDRFHYLLVDEYQDTNRAQYALVKLLAAKRRNLAVVGDDDQSIYSFRGADIRNILDFEKDYPDAKVILLEQNYRSTGHILAAATAVVHHNHARKEKALWTEAEKGEPIRVIVGATQEHEAQLITQQVRRLHTSGTPWREIAVIYRTNAQSRPLEQAMQRERVPYVLVGARRFYERREVKDLLAYLRLVVNPADDMALLRVLNVPRRGLGAKAIERVRQHAAGIGRPLLAAVADLAEEKTRAGRALNQFASLIGKFTEDALRLSPGALVHQIAEETGYAALLRSEETEEALGRLQNIEELSLDISNAEESLATDSPLETLQAFLDRISLASQVDDLPTDGGFVTLMTTHLAKGLEFDAVFVAGMVEGSFPHSRSSVREKDLEEERRLAYVAFTRARRHLFLTRSRTSRSYGGPPEPAAPSRFLAEIPQEHLAQPRRTGTGTRGLSSDMTRRMEGFLSRQAQAPSSPPTESRTVLEPESLGDFSAGTRVLHGEFGEGEIKAVSGAPSNPKLVVHFRNYGRKTLLARYAGLEILLG